MVSDRVTRLGIFACWATFGRLLGNFFAYWATLGRLLGDFFIRLHLEDYWAIFCLLGYIGKIIAMFWQNEEAQRKGNILGYFLFQLLFTISPQ
jgi:hypothetical protein